MKENDFMSNLYKKFNCTLYNMFANQVEKSPSKLAVIYDSMNKTVRLTYKELFILVDTVAKKIEDLRFDEQIKIGVYGERNMYTLVYMLAIFKTGNVYVPLDISYPDNHINRIIEEADIKLILKTSELDSHKLVEKEIESSFLDKVDFYNTEVYKELAKDRSSLEKIALIMYTSGSTGNPKGVVHRQYQLLNRFTWTWKNYSFHENDIACQRTNVNFMPSMWEFLGGLLQGVTTVILDSLLVKDPLRFIESLKKNKVTYLLLVPSLLKRMIESSEGIESLKNIKLLITAGEPISVDLLQKFKKCLPESVLLNDYGSTEMNGVLYFDTRNFDYNQNTLPKFKPIDNIQAYVLDDNLNPCKANEEGLLYIGGISLAVEYLNLPEESKRKFIINPFANGSSRIYNTEDLARYNENGEFEILGRKDLQVKINGIRMEIEAIEKVILEDSDVSECCILPREIRKGVKKLFAYIVKKEKSNFSSNELRIFIENKLPYYMVPSQIIEVKELPRLPNGKIDRQSLIKSTSNLKDENNNTVGNKKEVSQTELENILINIAAEVLGIEYKDINVNSEFKSVGFDSLTLVDFLNSINKNYNLKINVSDLFDYCTIRKLADYLLKENKLVDSNVVDQSDIDFQSHSDEGLKNRIAVIGMSGRFPGARNVNEFWNNLKNGVSSVTEVPKERWDIDEYFDSDSKKPFKTISRWGGFIDGIEEFDPEFFNISPRESTYMDPQQRLLLEEAWKAIEDSGYQDNELSNKSIGIFLGARKGDYDNLIRENNVPVDLYIALGCDLSILPSRIAYYLNLKGPCMSIDTACSSSLVAIHEACNSLRNEECEMALAGGVSLMCSPEEFIRSSKLGLLSKDGKCKTFDNKADGIALGESVGVVVIKRLDKAIKDNDRIYAVISGSGVNQDGKTNGITAPSTVSQFRLLKDTYDKFHINPKDITYVECHGTGTKLGDPIEINALTKAFRLYSKENNYCSLASVKTNIGHTVASSGVVGLIKIILSMKYKQIAPTLNYKQLNEHLDIKNSPFIINEHLKSWNRPRIAAINSFGLSGTNCHMVISEWDEDKKINTSKNKYFLIPISAKSKESLINKVEDLRNWLNNYKEEVSIDDIVYTLQKGRSHFRYRLAYIVSSIEDLINKLQYPVNDSDNLFKFSNLNDMDALVKEDMNAILILTDEVLENSESCLNMLRKISANYVLGDDINWKKYYVNRSNKIISMPTYPFKKNKFWISKKEEVLSVKLVRNNEFIKEHVINNMPVLAGAVQLEILFDKLSSYFKGKMINLKSIVWKNMLEVDEEEKNIKLRISSNKNNCKFSLTAYINSNNTMEICNGEVELNDYQDNYTSSVKDKFTDCNILIQGEELYDYYRKSGIDYGKSYRTVKRILKGNKRLISFLELDNDECEKDSLIIPQLLDGAFHSVIASLLNESENVIYLPFGIDTINIFRSFTNRCCAYIEFVKQDVNFIKANVYIENLRDELICKVEGLVIRGTYKNDNILYLKRSFELQDLITDNESRKNTIIFSNTVDNSIFNIFGDSVKFIRYSDRYNMISKNIFEVGNEEEDYRELFRNLDLDSSRPMQILYLWAIDSEIKLSENDNLLGISGMSLFYLAKAMINELNSNQEIKLVYCYSNKNNFESSYYSAVGALIKTIKLEKPNFNFRCVELSESSINDKSYLKLLKNELLDKLKPQIVKYKSGQRYVEKLERANISASRDVLNYSGLYVITGGLGGIGLILTKYLLTKKDISLLLIGHSKLSRKRNKILNELKNINKNVKYVQADVSKYDELKRALDIGKNTFGEINGVIHCAGIIKDNFMLKKTGSEFKKVIQPKINGVLNLDRLTQNDKLKYFILFSSITSVLGNIGQSDYAYANSFMDDFCIKRNLQTEKETRYGKTVSINWPLWKNGGMQIEGNIQEKLLKEKGMTSLSNLEGINSMENILINSDSNVAVLVGNEKLLQRMIDKHNEVESNFQKHKKILGVNTNSNLEKKIQGFLCELFGKQIGMEANDIDIDKEFDEYGINSLMIMDMLDQIESKLGEVSKTIFFEFNNIRELTKYFINNHKDTMSEIVGIESIPVEEEYIEEVVENSEPVKETIKMFNEVDDKIAIIGLSGKYPMADDLDQFWTNLEEGKDCITEIPSNRWDYRKYFDSDKNKVGTIYSKWGGFLSGIDKFNPLFFNMSPKEAEIIDPQERLFLETAWETIETSGHTRTELSNHEVGVYVGVMWGQYQLYGVDPNLKEKPKSSYASVANRVSYTFNFKGPSMAIDTMCSSSLTALKLACDALKKGEIDYALCGGVNIMSHPNKYFLLSQGKFASTDGRCRSFGDGGDGYVPGEGVGAVLLKPLKQAIRDKDYIYGVIDGYAINHGGKTNGYTVPSPVAQSKLIKKCLKEFNINPETISYIEAHGTGTALGDPIEISGISKAFKEFTSNKQFCPIGSVKSNIGHLEAAAGIAALTKVLLQFKNKVIVPSIHADVLNDKIDFKNSPIYVQRNLTKWESHDGNPRRASISSFGAGGSNAFIVVEEYENRDRLIKNDNTGEKIFVLNAKDKEDLKAYAKKIKLFLDNSGLKTTNSIKLPNDLLDDLKKLIFEIVGIPYEFIKDENRLDDYFSSEADLQEFIERINLKYKVSINLSNNFYDMTLENFKTILLNQLESYQVDKKVVLEEKSYDELLSLQNITYTFQIGRESMAERLAIVTDSIKDLAIKLGRYINDIADENVFIGSVDEKPEFLKMVQDDFSIEDILRKWYEEGNLDKVAKAWVLGAEVDWRRVYDTKDAYCIPMPTYPFKLERYWVTESENSKEEYKQKSLNSLIDTNISTIYKQAYYKKFANNDTFVKGHKVNDQVIVPGATLIEMAREAGELCNEPETVIKLKDIYWLNELNVNEKSENVEIKIICEEEKIKYEIYCKENEDLIYSMGIFEYAAEHDKNTNIDLNKIEQRCINKIDIVDLYNDFEKSHIQYDDNFRNITSIKKNKNEVIACVKVNSLNSNNEEVKLNPFILDAAFQTVKVLQASENSIDTPFSIDELIIYKKLASECLVYAIKDREKYNIFITEYKGDILTEIKGFALKSVDKNIGLENENQVICYEEQLVDNKLITLKDNEKVGNIVILGKQLDDVDRLIKEKSSDSKVFYIEDNNEKELFDKLENDNNEITHIIFNYQENADINLSLKMKNLVIKLLKFIKGLVNIQKKMKVLFVFAGDNAEYYSTSSNSFLKSVINENKRHVYKTIAFRQDKNNNQEIIKELFVFDRNIEEIVYDNEKRLTKYFVETNLLKKNNNCLFKENGVYVITGGARGLGLIFAKYLAEKGKCTVILVGRSELSISRLKQIQSIKSKDIHYLTGDVSNLEDVKNLYSSIKNKYGKVDGIIHSAGVIKDSFIKNKTEEELSLVIAPKINGLINLDTVTKNEKLDYLISFSSIAAILGNVGQVDYAFANGFVDSYLKARNVKVNRGERYGRSLSINWPLWKSGGMHVDENIEKNMFDMLGVKSLETLQGIKTFENIILSGKDRIMVLNGKKDKLRRWVADMYSKNSEEDNNVHEEPKENLENNININTIIKEIISNETKIPVSRIRDREDFSVYGIDSIMALSMGRKLSKRLDADLLTAFAQYSNVSELSDYILSQKIINVPANHEKDVQENNNVEIIKNKPGKNNIDIDKNMRFKNTISVKKLEKNEVAVVGISGRYPQTNNIKEFWENIKNGKNCIEEIPKERWDYNTFYNNKESCKNVASKWGGFIQNVDKFDPLFFNISPKEAVKIDPQERIMLEESWHALEDAGYSKRKLEKLKAQGKKVGVFIGTMYQQYPWIAKDREYGAVLSGSSYWSIANRISYFLNINGPSMVIDTACSSSLTAVHMAKESIEKGECDIAIVGGVNLTLHPYKYLGLSNEHLLGSEPRSMSLGDGDGYVPGEGAGVVILTSLATAQKDNDKIYGIIKASGINHSGKTSAYKVPSDEALKDLIISTFKDSDIALETISYYELAANGLKVADKIEIDALKEAFKDIKGTGRKVAIGSVKSNIGHLEAASGLSQLTKVILQLKNKQLVPSINCETLNPNIDLTDSCFEVQNRLEDWRDFENESEETPLRCAINSIGAGGSNCVLVVEEYKNNRDNRSLEEDNSPVLLAFSAKDEDRLKAILRNTVQYIEEYDDVLLSDLSYTLYRREYMEERMAFIVKDKIEFVKLCNSYLDNNEIISGIFKGNIYEEEQVANHQNLDGIADKWVKGKGGLDDIYLNTTKYKLISIPLYPFEENSYWIDNIKTYKQKKVEVKENETSIIKQLKSMLCNLLDLEVNKIDGRKRLDVYGTNSIITSKLINLIEDKYGVRLSIKQLIDNYTLNKISKIIEESSQGNINNKVNEISHETEENHDYIYYLENLILSIIEEKNISIEDAISVKENLLQFIDNGGKEYGKENL